MVDDDNLVSIPDRAQAVGDDDDGLATIECVEVLHDSPLVVGIKGVRRLVKEDVVGILVHRTGDEDALTLPLAQSHTVTAYLRVVFQWQRHYIVMYARYPSGLQQTFLVDVAVVNGSFNSLMKKSLTNEMLTLMEICNNSHRRMKSMAVRLKVSIS